MENDQTIFEYSKLKNRFGNDDKLVNEILREFIRVIPGKISSLKTALEKNNRQEIESVVHSIKGNALNLSAHKVAEISSKFEKSCLTDPLPALECSVNILSESLMTLSDVIKQNLEL
ncbi:MAG: Hpt domain-containing protein [Candidatus Riflebacteria bacterium]|nr:Hpt domain-containing protein [Candidatus Riflebacteria bacterium]